MLIILIIESEDCEGEVENLVHGVSGTEYVLTYEDKDGDWMMAGDVPWKYDLGAVLVSDQACLF